MSLTVIENDLSAVTLSGAAVGNTILCTHADGCQVTLPDDLEDGDWFWLVQGTDSPVTVVGTNVLSPGGTSTRGRYSQISAWYSAIAEKWLLAGDVAVAGSVPVVAATAATLETLPAQYDAVLLDGDVWPYDDADHSGTGTDKIAADPSQTHYVARAIAPTGVAGAYVRTREPGVYHLRKFGGANTTPWLRAIALMDPGEVLVVDPNGEWYIDEPLIFEADGLSIVNPYGRRDYSCILRPSEANIDVITLASAGGVVKGINIWGYAAEMALYDKTQGNGGTYGTCRGLVLDRSVLSAGAAGANLDMRVEDCGFYGMRVPIYFAGRNVTIRCCSFDQTQKMIEGALYTYGGGTKTQMRGIKIHDNVFHNCGYRKNMLLDTTTAAAVIDIPIDDAIVEGDKAINSVEVHDNYSYKCHTFYDGPVSGSRVQNNECYLSTGPLALLNDGGGSYTSENVPGFVTGNLWWGHAEAGAETLYNARNAIKGDKIHNLVLGGNYLFQCAEAMIRLEHVYNLHSFGDTIAYANMSYARGGSTDSSAVEIGALGADSYQGVSIDGMRIQGSNAGPGNHTYAITSLYGGQFITIFGGQLTAGRSGLIHAASGVEPHYTTYTNAGAVLTNAYQKDNSIPLGRVTLLGQLAPTNIGEAEAFGGAIVHDNIQAAVALNAAEFVYLNTSAKWALAKADSLNTVGYTGIVMTGAAQNGYPVVLHRGPGLHSGFTGSISPGRPVWLDNNTAGTLRDTPPATSGHVVQFLGYIATDQNGIIMDPGPPVVNP